MPELGCKDEEPTQRWGGAGNSTLGGEAACAKAPWQVGGQPQPGPHLPGSAPRCGCVTMLRSPNKTTAVKQWEQRWIKNCLCGGLWRRAPLSYP